MFRNKTMLITGGTGSFGNALVKRLVNEKIKEIRILSRDEKKQEDMRRKFANNKIKFYIGDIKDRSSLVHAMAGVDYLFHAAALKQVPSCEMFPMEAVKTNIIGTENVIEEAICAKISRIICLSTDKAVHPINAMGISKAMMEKILISKARLISGTGISVMGVRYANVIGSRGSVIPIFEEQIRHSESLTVTDPKMTRFLMSLDEAIELVLYAFEHGENGDLFVQKSMSATVEGIAQAMIEIHNSDVSTKIIGARHGEKKHETLLTKEEWKKSIDLGKFFKIQHVKNHLISSDITIGEEMKEDYTSFNASRLTIKQIKEKILHVSKEVNK